MKSPISLPNFPAPLKTAADMVSTWTAADLDFDSAADRIIKAHEDDGDVRDLPLTDLRTWAVAPHGEQLALVPLSSHHEPMPIRATGFSNLAARLGAPCEFVRDELPGPLQIAVINWLLANAREAVPVTLRLRGNEVSAVVSGRYAVFEPDRLLEVVREALHRLGLLNEARVTGGASGLVDNVRLVFPSERVAVEPGDVSSVGLDVTSSCFGKSAVHVSPIIFRLVCSNGLKVMERRPGFSFRHVGEEQRLREGVREAIPSAMLHARGFMEHWRQSVGFMIEDVERQVSALRLSMAERRGFEVSLQDATGGAEIPRATTVYAFINAMTDSAKALRPARRLEVEQLAGETLRQYVERGR